MSRPGPSSFLRRSAKLVLSLGFAVFALAACSSDGVPQSYIDQPDIESGVPLVERNWMEGCEVGLVSSELAQDANGVCECAFRTLSAPVADGGILFEEFVELNNELSGDPTTLADRENLLPTERALVNIVSTCIAGG